jgi:hypothetical protein
MAGGSGDRRCRIDKEPMEDEGDTLAATTPASGEESTINLFWAIGSSISPAHKQRLRMEAATAMAATYEWFRAREGWCVSV